MPFGLAKKKKKKDLLYFTEMSTVNSSSQISDKIVLCRKKNLFFRLMVFFIRHFPFFSFFLHFSLYCLGRKFLSKILFYNRLKFFDFLHGCKSIVGLWVVRQKKKIKLKRRVKNLVDYQKKLFPLTFIYVMDDVGKKDKNKPCYQAFWGHIRRQQRQ